MTPNLWIDLVWTAILVYLLLRMIGIHKKITKKRKKIKRLLEEQSDSGWEEMIERVKKMEELLSTREDLLDQRTKLIDIYYALVNAEDKAWKNHKTIRSAEPHTVEKAIESIKGDILNNEDVDLSKSVRITISPSKEKEKYDIIVQLCSKTKENSSEKTEVGDV